MFDNETKLGSVETEDMLVTMLCWNQYRKIIRGVRMNL
jgi:hypothetical protein